jgi:hypothetical protein
MEFIVKSTINLDITNLDPVKFTPLQQEQLCVMVNNCGIKSINFQDSIEQIKQKFWWLEICEIAGKSDPGKVLYELYFDTPDTSTVFIAGTTEHAVELTDGLLMSESMLIRDRIDPSEIPELANSLNGVLDDFYTSKIIPLEIKDYKKFDLESVSDVEFSIVQQEQLKIVAKSLGIKTDIDFKELVKQIVSAETGFLGIYQVGKKGGNGEPLYEMYEPYDVTNVFHFGTSADTGISMVQVEFEPKIRFNSTREALYLSSALNRAYYDFNHKSA